jgi:hypothetical protein
VDNRSDCGQLGVQDALAAGVVVPVVDDEAFDFSPPDELDDEVSFDEVSFDPLSAFDPPSADVAEELLARLSVR